MINIDNKTILNLILTAILKATIWAFTYYYIRSGLNPEVQKEKYITDAFYGALVQFVSNILFPIVLEVFTNN